MAVHSHHHRGQSGITYLSAAAARVEADKRDTATVQKIINEVLSSPSIQGENGATMTFAKETRDLLIECCVEFITMLSSEANEIAEKDAKKTIACEHITKALEELEFADYVPELVAVADQFKNSQVAQSRERKQTKIEQSGMSNEELIKAQEELFRSAGEKYNSVPS
ncbi:negative cofactor 2 transcription regulator complex subunit ncb2 [Friedmanniomyces endolithicus]|nr:negative cofactor 2 transcription regulator complex subunit ncb2 [Friedmanniomyces endolithicus]